MSMASVTNIRYDDMSVTDYLTTDSSIMMRQVFESCRRHDVTSSLETIMRGLLPPHSQHQVDVSKFSDPARWWVETTWNAALLEGWGSRPSSCHWRRPQVLCWGEAFIFKIKSVWRLFEKEYLHRLTFFLPLLRRAGWLVLGCVQFEGFRSNFNFVGAFLVTIEQWGNTAENRVC